MVEEPVHGVRELVEDVLRRGDRPGSEVLTHAFDDLDEEGVVVLPCLDAGQPARHDARPGGGERDPRTTPPSVDEVPDAEYCARH